MKTVINNILTVLVFSVNDNNQFMAISPPPVWAVVYLPNF